MNEIDLHLLERVVGGGDTTTTLDTPVGKLTETKSDYATCVDTMRAETAKQYPDTRPSLLGVPAPWATDTNAAARAQATVSNIATNCGKP